jgi:uncharacterized protein (TIGR03790 family)
MKRLAIFLLLCLLRPAAALEPENLLLICNKNVPEGRKLAEFYTAQRKVPEQRILELDLPAGDEISFDAYENQVVPGVREFIAANRLGSKVTCLVTFYGVPLKIAARVNSPADKAELAALHKELPAAVAQLGAAVAAVEAIAREVAPSFHPATDGSLNGLLARDHAARDILSRHAAQLKDPQQLQPFMARVQQALAPIVGSASIAQQQMQGLISIANNWTPEQKRQAETLRDALTRLRARLDTLQNHHGDPKQREELRTLVKQDLGLAEYTRLLAGMIDYLNTDATGAAFDSELACVNANFYTRVRSLPNPLHYKASRTQSPPIFMVMRLDAPKPEQVHEIITQSIKTETDGLTGRIVVDAGGNLSIDPKNAVYAGFDLTLKRLAGIVQKNTNLPLTLDVKPAILAKDSVKEPIAVYCGWYALRNYTPPGKFAPGAVGYHIASFELTSLHTAAANEWCRGLLADGVVGTLGPVNEPYLNAFPGPDEFFPLLFTGKLTLAEVYWKTTPLISWQIAMIGDPLYVPYKAHPALGVEALTEGLREAVKPGR